MKIFIVAITLAITLFPQAHAKFERGHGFTYRTRIWNEAFAGEGIRLLAAQTLQVVQETLQAVFTDAQKKEDVDFSDNFLTPNEVLSLDKAHKKIDVLINTINKYIEQERESSSGGEFSWADALPDALVIYFGPRLSGKLGLGLNITGVVGFVLIPQLVEKIDNYTGEVVDTFLNVDPGLMIWPQFGVGAGLGASAAVIAGVGFLWNAKNNITSIEDIPDGVGLGATGSISAIAGTVFNSGAIFDFSSSNPFSPSLFYVRAGITGGAQLEASVSAAGQLLISPGTVLGLLSKTQKKMIADFNVNINREITELLEQQRAADLGDDNDGD